MLHEIVGSVFQQTSSQEKQMTGDNRKWEVWDSHLYYHAAPDKAARKSNKIKLN